MQNSTALCPCQSGEHYADCCQPLHLERIPAPDALRLMRSRYAAYVLQLVDYIVATTVPGQQPLLERDRLQQWAKQTQWLGLEIVAYRAAIDKIHSTVEFKAFFTTAQGRQVHHEKSLFVRINGRWYFVDPTVSLPSMKQPCVCGSGKKFKHCCGGLL